MSRFLDWLSRKWQPERPDELLRAYHVTFSTADGRRVLQHLMDNTYCQICPTADAVALATHNGRRSVVHEILQNLDRAESPGKYDPQPKEITWPMPTS